MCAGPRLSLAASGRRVLCRARGAQAWCRAGAGFTFTQTR